MSLSALAYMKLPDVPPIEDQGLYNFLLQLKFIVEQMRGDKTSGTRIITYADLTSLGLL